MEEKKQPTVTIPVEEYLKLKKEAEWIKEQEVILSVNSGYNATTINLLLGKKIQDGDLRGLPIADLLKSLIETIRTQADELLKTYNEWGSETHDYKELLSYLQNVSWFDFKVYQSELRRNNPTNKRK